LEHTHLVSEHHDLDVPLGLSPSTRHNENEQSRQAEIEEREEHTASCLSPVANFQVKDPIGLLAPFTLASLEATLPTLDAG
jgi:hypothetical protein